MSLHNRNSLEPWMHDSIRFYDHQVLGVRRMAEMRSVLLADEMGLGKSLQTLAAFCLDIKRGMSQTMLIVCPASLKVNWYQEIGKFTRLHREILVGPKPKRQEQIARFRELAGPRILIVNYEQLIQHLYELNKCRFDVATFDEAHMIKNPKARRTKAATGLFTTRSMLLTGSPILNQVDDLYTLLNKVAPGEFEDYYRFTHRYAVFGGYRNKQVVGAKNQHELHNRLQNVMIRRKKADVLDLPAVQYITRAVELHPKQRKYYNQVFEEMMLDYGNGEKVAIGSVLTKFLRCKQICGSTATIDGIDEDNSYKLDLATIDAKQLLDSGQKVVAFTQFRGVQELYARRLRGYGTTKTDYPIYLINGDVRTEPDGRAWDDPKKKWCRQEIVDIWSQNERAGIIIATFGAAGVGLNMTAASHGQFLDKLFVPDLNQQAVDRLHRIGASTEQAVQILEYIVTGTVEERVEKINSTKKKMSSSIVDGTSWTARILREALQEDKAA
ncbi:DNA helicase [Rhodococcus phage Reynauld]|uniref:DNA helicase n=1 Tax=Rhodococcus phage Reynauld TaxID=3062845 RepID=A0ACD4UHJ3_9CAUD|nr:DNA helicase [Rhodococcus phage Reynauld]